MANEERVPLKKRVNNLCRQALHDMAHLITAKEKAAAEEYERDLKDTVTRIAALTGQDPNEMITAIGRLCEEQKRLIEEDLVEEALAAMIIAQVRQSDEWEAIVVEAEEAAGATEKVEDLDREGEGEDGEGGEGEGEESDEHTPEVDDDVLDGLDTVYAN